MRRPLIVLALLLTTLALVAAGCCEGEVTATPETVEGTIPEETTGGGGNADLPALELTGDAAAGEEVFASSRLRRVPHALGGGLERHRRAEPRRGRPVVRARGRARHARPGRHARVRRAARATADRGRRGVRLRRLAPSPLSLVDGFPQPVQAFACDLDGTLIDRARGARGADARRDRAVAGRRSPGPRRDGPDVPLGRAVPRAGGDPRAGRLLPGRRRGRPADARRSSCTSRSSSTSPGRRSRRCRRTGSRRTSTSTTSSTSPRRPSTRAPTPASSTSRSPRSATCSPGSSGSRRSSSRSPTRSGSPRSASTSSASFGERLFLTTSLPHLLELGHPGASKGSGIAFVTELLRIDLAHVVAFGDGENDVELLAVAGLGIAIEDAHPRLRAIADRTCPGPRGRGRRSA